MKTCWASVEVVAVCVMWVPGQASGSADTSQGRTAQLYTSGYPGQTSQCRTPASASSSDITGIITDVMIIIFTGSTIIR